jgi:acetyltransferase-like isoleucine patch superfamily enzyme
MLAGRVGRACGRHSRRRIISFQSSVFSRTPAGTDTKSPLWVRIANRGRLKARRLEEACATYFVNHVVVRVPLYSSRAAAVPSLLGWSCAKDVALSMGCVCTGRNITIGTRTVINRHCYLDGRGELTIGANCSVSPEVYILTATHDPQSPRFRPIMKQTRIGDHVWIGARALLLPGIVVGDRAIVGAGAVVTRDVEPGSIVAGNPARVIGHRGCTIDYSLSYFPPLRHRHRSVTTVLPNDAVRSSVVIEST